MMHICVDHGRAQSLWGRAINSNRANRPARSSRLSCSAYLYLLLMISVLLGLCQGDLITADCSESPLLSNMFSKSGQTTCSPSQCVFVSNTAATAPTPSPATETSPSYAFSKAQVFKNFAGKTCDNAAAVVKFPSVCSRTSLASNFMLGATTDGTAHKESGIRLLYCNDKYLVIHTTNIPNHDDGLAYNPHPPGSGLDSSNVPTNSYGEQTVTRSHVVQYSVYKIPLIPQDLGASTATSNNALRFSETFTAYAASTVATSTYTITFSTEVSGKIMAGYTITSSSSSISKKTLSSCDSAEIVGGTGGVSSTTLTISWTVRGSVCNGKTTESTCTDTGSSKYVYISSVLVQLKNCAVIGGVGTCSFFDGTSRSIAAGTTLFVKSSSTGSVTCTMNEYASASVATTDLITGGHTDDLPAFTTSSSHYAQTSANYPGIPIYGPLAISVTGQVLYPIFDDQGYYSQEMCEVDKCNAHAGKGFDYHYHGDPYHHTPGSCLYSSADYSDAVSGHPPRIGYSLDGYSVYGRHLATTNLGESVSLDDCGGHTHGSYGYHYHAQVAQSTAHSQSTLYSLAGSAVSYYIPIPGVYKCWRGDIGAQNLFGTGGGSAGVRLTDRADFADLQPCTGTIHYFKHSSLDSSSFVTALDTAFPSQFPTDSPSASPTASPTPAPVLVQLSFVMTGISISQCTDTIKSQMQAALATALGIDASTITSLTVSSVSSATVVESIFHDLGNNYPALFGRTLSTSSVSVSVVISSPTAAAASTLLSTNAASATSTFVSAFNAASGLSVSATGSFSISIVTAMPTASPIASPTASSALSGNNKIIIGVVVGGGGLLAIAGVAFVVYYKRQSASSSGSAPPDSPMRIGSSVHRDGQVELVAVISVTDEEESPEAREAMLGSNHLHDRHNLP